MSAASSSQGASSTAAASTSYAAQLPASVRAILGDKDLDYLAAQLGSQHERLVTCLKSEGNLAYFKVADLKLLISYLKGKLKKNIKISGNKCDLAQRIAEELFPSGAGSDDGAGPTQTTLRYSSLCSNEPLVASTHSFLRIVDLPQISRLPCH
jgi:hypothetical protein